MKPAESDRRARYYLLRAKGRWSLSEGTEQWQRQINAIARISRA